MSEYPPIDSISLASDADIEESAAVFAPNALATSNDDAMSELSKLDSRYTVGNHSGKEASLRAVRTETRKTLHNLGLSETPTRTATHVPVDNPVFPEEYTLETETGLVPLEALEELGRLKSVTSKKNLAKLTTALSAQGDHRSSSESPESYADKEHVERPSTQLDRQSTRASILVENTGEKEEIDSEVQLVTFKLDDPQNPQNWPMWYKWLLTLVLSVYVVAAAYGSACLAGGLFTVQEQFHVSAEVSNLTVSLMVIGFAVGPLLWAPLSEQIGRRPVYFISFGLYTLFNVPCAVAKNIGTVLVCRFLCGCFAASALTNVGASLVDIHKETRGVAIAMFAFAPYTGPVIGGLVNGFISVGTRRYDMIIWVNMAFAGVMWIAVSLIPETYAPVILKKRAKSLRKATGNQNIVTEQELSPMTFSQLVNDCLYRPLRFCVNEPVLVLVCGFVALIYALLYAFFFAYPYIFNTLYGYEDNLIGLMFIPIIIGAGLALTTTPILEKQYALICKRRKPEPEDRLIGAMIGSPFPCIALFILGATSYKHIIWVGPASLGIAFGYGMVLIYYSLNNYIIDTYAKYAASALATKVFLRSGAGAAFPLFTTQMYQRLGLQWASWLLAFISLAMIAIPFSFYYLGKGLRAKLCKEDYTI